MIARIRKILQVKHLTPSAFADKVGVPRSTISHLLSGRNNPSLEFIKKILDTYPDIRIQWLINGEGNMLSGSNTLFPEEDQPEEIFPEQEPEPKSGGHKNAQGLQSASEDVISYPDKEQKKIQASGEDNKNVETDNKSDKIADNKHSGKDNYAKKENKIARVMIFYTDGTFSEYIPSAGL